MDYIFSSLAQWDSDEDSPELHHSLRDVTRAEDIGTGEGREEHQRPILPCSSHVHDSCYYRGLCGCPGSGQRPETMLVSKDLADTRMTLTWVVCAASRAMVTLDIGVQATAKGHVWVCVLGLCSWGL